MVLCKLPVPGRPAHLDYSRARACALAIGASEGYLDIFLSSIICLRCPVLRATTRYRLKYCLKRVVQPKPTN